MGDLIIGVGGTGGKVVRALRNRIRQSRGAEKDTNHYLCLDTMGYGYFLMEIYNKIAHRDILTTDTSKELEQGHLDKLLKDSLHGEDLAISRNEYLQFKGLEPESLARLLKDPLDRDGNYYWLRTADLRTTLSVPEKVFQFKEGAGQYRQIGRLGAFCSADEILKRLRALQSQRGIQTNQNRSVYIVGSLAGGTGSGNFIDIGVLARRVFASGTHSGDAKIKLLLLLDGAFAGDYQDGLNSKRSDLQVTTYAALRELSRIQSAPIPTLPLSFRYDNLEPIELHHQTVFDDVILMDFDDRTMDESTRVRTVYPTLAEMIDLLTADGTGPLINVKMVNINKEIRTAQASAANKTSEGNQALSVWQSDPFAPYFMTFNFKRYLFPKRLYEMKAASEAVASLFERMMPLENDRFDNQQMAQAFAAMSWTSLSPFYRSLFGAEASEQDFSLQGRDPFENNPVERYLGGKNEQLGLFNNPSDRDLTQLFGQSQSQFIPAADLFPEKEATRDPKLRVNLFNNADRVRESYFGIKNLNEFIGLHNLSLNSSGSLCQELKRACEEKSETAKRELIKNLEENLQGQRGSLRSQRWVLLGIKDLFLKVLRQKADERHKLLGRQRDSVATAVQRARQNYMDVADRGKDCLAAGQEYQKAEALLFMETRRYLASFAQIQFLQEFEQELGHWIAEIQRIISLFHGTTDDSSFRAARRSVEAVNNQLAGLCTSRNVSLGFSNETDITMNGFEAFLVGDLTLKLFQLDQVRWEVPQSSKKLRLLFKGQELPGGLKGFELLRDLAAKELEPHLRDWSFFRYLWEYVCQRDENRMRQVAEELSNELKMLSASMSADSHDPRIRTNLYVISQEFDTGEGAGKLHQYLVNECSKLAVGFEPIPHEEAKFEFTLARLDSGLMVDNVEKLRSVRNQYVTYIGNQSLILPLVHILPEEENMVVREREMYASRHLDGQRLLPSVLSPLFANPKLVEVFLGLYKAGFINSIDVSSGQTRFAGGHYFFTNVNEIARLLKTTSDQRREFLEKLWDEPQQYYGQLFRLNPDVVEQAAGALGRPTGRGSDFFTAMARFVQRLPNGDEKHPQLKNFPWSKDQIGKLGEELRGVWAQLNPHTGQHLCEELMRFGGELRETAMQLDQLEQEQAALPDPRTLHKRMEEIQANSEVSIEHSPLGLKENAEFLRQLAIFAEQYHEKMKPPVRAGRKRWI